MNEPLALMTESLKSEKKPKKTKKIIETVKDWFKDEVNDDFNVRD